MIVIFVSECERRALKKTRRILNRYACQIGRRTWQARMSLEGLKGIQAELRKASSRQMAVACHRVAGRTRTELLWIVGSRRHFNHDGQYAFSSSQRDFLRPPREAEPMERLCAYLAELAGLFHDIGKDNAFFQNKLQEAINGKGKPVADPVRHELLSLELAKTMVLAACDVDRFKKADDLKWLSVFSELKAFSALFSDASKVLIRDGAWQVGNQQTPDTEWPIPTKPQRTPLLWAWLWILGSHHRLPYGKYMASDSSSLSLIKERHVRCESDDKYPDSLRDNLRPADTNSRFWQQDVRWLNQVSKCSERIRHWCVNHQSLLPDPVWQNAFFATIIHFSRTGMMCADHTVSARDNHTRNPAPPGVLIANTTKGVKTGPGAVLGTHLYEVGRQAASMTRLLWQQDLGLPFIAKDDLPSPMTSDSGAVDHSPFAWQDATCAALKPVAKADANTGFIGFVQAGTGCGKTRACARIMATVSAGARYTVALGLRSLTLQTGKSYRDELELNGQQLTTLVGESLITRLQKESEQQGSESRAAFADDLITIDGDMADQPLPQALCDLLEGQYKHQQLLSAPILVCTADHITAAADATRGSHLIAMLRVISSDLVLDEIDNYDETALVVLGKLVFLTAMAGRRVLLSSATLSPAIAEAFFMAYQTGYQLFCQRRSIQTPKLAVGLFSQFSDLCQLHWLDMAEREKARKKFIQYHGKFNDALIENMDRQPVKRRIGWLDLPQSCSLETLAHCIYQSAQELHNLHAQTDPVTGKRLSLGLVRVSNTAPCWYLSKYLCELESDAGWDHRVICYHARLSTLARWHTEQWLDTALNRKNAEAIWQEPLIRRLMDNTPGKQVMIIVVATPVEEVGRDHDFDWGILEPASTRSVVQSAGRIRRHRDASDATDNVRLLPTVIRHLLDPAKPAAYYYPGVESEPDYLLSSKQAKALFPASWTTRLDARYSLQTPSEQVAEITCLEHKKQRDYLLEQSEARLLHRSGNRDTKACNYSLKDWHENVFLGANDRHASGNPFRSRERRIMYWQDNQENWWHIATNASGLPEGEPVSANEQVNAIDINPDRLFLNMQFPASDWQTHYESLKQRAYSDASDLFAQQSLLSFGFPHKNGISNLVYHFWLGGCVDKSDER